MAIAAAADTPQPNRRQACSRLIRRVRHRLDRSRNRLMVSEAAIAASETRLSKQSAVCNLADRDKRGALREDAAGHERPERLRPLLTNCADC
jgi:hypothetical protein